MKRDSDVALQHRRARVRVHTVASTWRFRDPPAYGYVGDVAMDPSLVVDPPPRFLFVRRA
jgi:hypothetical protein